MTRPAVSLLLVVKNGMPYLREAVESVRLQTFRDFEVIVQDGGSSDGSLELLGAVGDIPGWDVVSELDSGIGDAYNRALKRASGSVIGSLDSDNVLEPHALGAVTDFLSARPELAAAYGGSNMLDASGDLLYPWMPGEFDLLRLLTMELVPPFAVSFFVRSVCGDALRFDEQLATCADFDLWLRLSDRPIARIPQVLGGTRLSEASMTRRSGTYDQYIEDKTTALERFFRSAPSSAVVECVRDHALAGLYLWSAESVYDIERRRTSQFEAYLAQAAQADPGSPWLSRLASLPAEADADRDEDSSDIVPASEPAPSKARPYRRPWLKPRPFRSR
jgi:glycosyltransferase involved in cell wall biosynthesis